MRITNFIVSLLLTASLSACSVAKPGESLSNAAVEGQRFGPAANAFVASAMSISGCPAGRHAKGVAIATGSQAIITDVNGGVGYSLGANGVRTQTCVLN